MNQEQWQQENTWFMTNAFATGYAVAISDMLLGTGVEAGSPAYYSRLDEVMKSRFPGLYPVEKYSNVIQFPVSR